MQTDDSDIGWWKSVESSVATGMRICNTIAEFDEACKHVVSLLHDAATLATNGSHPTGAFLAITAIEETAKIHIGMFRRGSEKIARRQDPLTHHKTKHHLALGPTISMGGRLQVALGEDRLQELVNLGRTDSFVRIRESAIYLDQSEHGLLVPKSTISKAFAFELLLLAIEVFDDALVGNTNQSFKLGNETDQLFSLVSSEYQQVKLKPRG